MTLPEHILADPVIAPLIAGPVPAPVPAPQQADESPYAHMSRLTPSCQQIEAAEQASADHAEPSAAAKLPKHSRTKDKDPLPMDRTSVLLQGIDKATARGVEIGPFFNPIAAKKNGWKTIVVDFKNMQELQLAANEHPSEAMRAMAGNIEEVDIVWKGEPIDQAVAARFGQDHEMDYVIGSHTIEHMVDFLGFMKSASNLLKVGGVLALAVPDLRYEFDFFRSPSTLGQVLGVHRRKAERHAPEILFDTIAYSVNVSGVGCWMPGTYMPEINLSSTLKHAWLCYQHDLPRTQYIDSHAWYFTPSSFQLLVWELWHLGLTDFTLKNISSAAHNNTGSEFIVQLVKRDRVAEAIAITPQAEVESHRKNLLLGMVAELAERAVNLGMATFKMQSGLRSVG